MRSFGEHQFFALFRRVGLDYPNAGEAFGQAAGDVRVDLAALAEELDEDRD